MCLLVSQHTLHSVQNVINFAFILLGKKRFKQEPRTQEKLLNSLILQNHNHEITKDRYKATG